MYLATVTDAHHVHHKLVVVDGVDGQQVTQVEAAKAMGVTQARVSRIERGELQSSRLSPSSATRTTSSAERLTTIERRGEAYLDLMRDEHFEAEAAGPGTPARFLVVPGGRNRGLAEDLLAGELPWLRWLPEAERGICLRELLADLLTGADTGLLLPFARNVASWRATAELWSDPQRARELQGPFPGDGPQLDRPQAPAA